MSKKARQTGSACVAAALCALAALGAAGVRADAADLIRSHGYSFFGDLKYPADYAAFGYVNPGAPKGGEISIAVTGTFDSMNPYSRKGRAGGFSSSMYESLLGGIQAGGGTMPSDSVTELYGLLAHTLEYPEDKSWVVFHMRPEARFSDGTPVTAHDVLFSHNLLLDEGLKSYAEAVRKRVPKAEVLDDHRIKFHFADGISRRNLIDQVGGVPVWSRKWFEETGAKLDESRLETSPGSSPYVVESVDPGRRIVFSVNPDYWGWHLPINRGRHNFERVRLEYFLDPTAGFEAFKTGLVTYRTEGEPKRWITGYDFPAALRGDVVKDPIPKGSPPAMKGIVMNLGSAPLQDRRVRQAFELAYNFEWINRSLLQGLSTQQRSFSTGMHLEAQGVPAGAELEFLESLENPVPREVMEAAPWRPHESDPERLFPRRDLRRALGLLAEAGWTPGDDGQLRNAAGEAMRIRFLMNSSGTEDAKAVAENFTANLRKLGIDAFVETVDPSQYTARSRDRDYDLIIGRYDAHVGTGTGLLQRLGTESAAFSLFNPAGFASPLVDEIINRSLLTSSQEEEDMTLRALDRVLRHELFVIPTGFVPDTLTAYWNMHEHPESMPPFALGVVDFWWRDAGREERLKASGALR